MEICFGFVHEILLIAGILHNFEQGITAFLSPLANIIKRKKNAAHHLNSVFHGYIRLVTHKTLSDKHL